MIRLQNILKASLQDVLKMSWRRFCRRLEDVLARGVEDVLKTSWRCLEDVWPRRIYWSWSRCLEDVFWRRMTKANIFVLIKTSRRRPQESSEDEDERHLQDVFRRLHQGECLLGWQFSPHLFNCKKAGRVQLSSNFLLLLSLIAIVITLTCYIWTPFFKTHASKVEIIQRKKNKTLKDLLFLNINVDKIE